MKRLVAVFFAVTLMFSHINVINIKAVESNDIPFEVIYLTEEEADELLYQAPETEFTEIIYSKAPRCATCTHTTFKVLQEKFISNRYLGLLPAHVNGPTYNKDFYYMSNRNKASISISLTYGPVSIAVSNEGTGGGGVLADKSRKSKLGMTVDGYETCWEAVEKSNATGAVIRKYYYSTFRITNEAPTVVYYK